jgi:hypothetical protein
MFVNIYIEMVKVITNKNECLIHIFRYLIIFLPLMALVFLTNVLEDGKTLFYFSISGMIHFLSVKDDEMDFHQQQPSIN